jgi:hypothetical protein
MRNDDAKPKAGGSADQAGRRPYTKPKLVEYGSVAKLTQSGGSTVNEPAPKMKGCL